MTEAAKWIDPWANVLAYTPAMESLIEYAARTCYASTDKMTGERDATKRFIAARIGQKHESILEHGIITVEITCNRAIANELVRHRIASYCQESTRYCNYSKDKFNNCVQVIWPSGLSQRSGVGRQLDAAVTNACGAYLSLLRSGITPEVARDVLPLCTATRIVCTMNVREWRHFFEVRCDKKAHPDMRRIALGIWNTFKMAWPALFGDYLYDMEGVDPIKCTMDLLVEVFPYGD